MQKSRFRMRFPFWLDLNKPDERELAEQVSSLKEKKLFAKTIRDGIRLICDLREGRLGVLAELFPWVVEEMGQGRTPQTVDALETHLARLEKLMGQGISLQFDTKAQHHSTGSRPLSVPSFALPHFDDDDDAATIILTKSTTNNAANNFINTMKGLQQ